MPLTPDLPAGRVPARPGLAERLRSAVGGTLAAAAVDVFAVLLRAVQLLGWHWPVLLAVLLAGEAGRYAALWAAVELSDVNGTLGVLVLVLGPLSAVAALIIALHTLRDSLPSLRAMTGDDGGGSRPRVLNVLGSVMVPFLAIYASYGFLDEDVFRFINAAVTDELFDVDVLLGTDGIDVNRTALATGWMAMVVVAIALVLRYGLGILGQRRNIRGLAWVAAYVEVVWLVTLARVLATHQEAALNWVQDRAALQAVADFWKSAVSFAGPVGQAVDTASRWLFELLASADALLVIPVAWLTVGAVVYGQQLREPARRPPSHRRVRGNAISARIGGHRLAGSRLAESQHVREVGNQLTGGLGDRFGALAKALRRLAVAGLAPMLLFALAFVIAQRLENAVDLAWRELLGPMPLSTYLAFAPHTGMISHVIGTTAVVCLLGAAIDRVLDRGRQAAGVTTR
ncbi:hypothetical protein [Jiangella asiatica]|uniref:Uncharacterized protein n=1 Tax=Jiangella asiatica TaxID=2530372 RepID=A0A4R5CQE3_9ACTN|nr:hypothetical protein [Jiangella asiatica]TDE01041.1 hypothetical protein E1269_23955 [Jiangella asiatica]